MSNIIDFKRRRLDAQDLAHHLAPPRPAPDAERTELLRQQTRQAADEAIRMLEIGVVHMRRIADAFEGTAHARRFHQDIDFIQTLLATARTQAQRI